MVPFKKLTFITVVYWILLGYILAALVWWFIALNQQSAEMAQLRLGEIAITDPQYTKKAEEVADFRKRKMAQYSGEGFIFFLLIIVGAVFVYRATRKQLQLAKQQQNFMMAVTHELKTPIAIARLNLETLQKRKLDEMMQQTLLKSALQETERLTDLANNILLASNMDGGAPHFLGEMVDFSAVLSESVKQFQLRYPYRNFITDIEPGCTLWSDKLLLRLLVNNLLDNAKKYTPEKGPVAIKLDSGPHSCFLKIADTGVGIGDDEKQKVFDKFYRVGNENTRSAKGTGLGLYLCKRIVKDHGGSIWIEDNIPTGAIFCVELKKRGK